MKNSIIIEAEYADIIGTLLQEPYSINSITKLVFIAFCSKNERDKRIYVNRKMDFVDIFMKNINLKLMSHSEEITTIFSVIEKLHKNNFIDIHKDKILLRKKLLIETENEFLKFCLNKNPNPIMEVNKLDSKAFMEEVLRYV